MRNARVLEKVKSDQQDIGAIASGSFRMNIGIYIRTLTPPSPASARFQESILEGLQQLNSPRFHFIVLSEAIPVGYDDTPHIRYVAVARTSDREAAQRRRKLLLGGMCRRLLRLVGAGSTAPYLRLTRWMAYEPPHYQQLRDLNIRLIWNLGVNVMESFVPYVMVVWDANHRLHTMFPEFSYVTAQGKLYDQYKAVFERFTPFMERASYLIVGTEQGKREVVDAFGAYPGKIRVIPFPTPTLPPARTGNPDRPRSGYLFYPGRFWPHKNQLVLVRALHILRERWNMILDCVFSGFDNGNLDYVMRTAENLGVRKQIEYLGNVSEERLADLYRSAAALVYCSAVGPDNFPPLEAMSVGCPVITADVPGAREQYGDAVMFFDWTDEVQLAECIKRLIEDADLRQSLIEKGLKRASLWTPLNYANSMVDVLEEFSGIARLWERCDYSAAR